MRPLISRWLRLVGVLAVAVALAACSSKGNGVDDDDDDDGEDYPPPGAIIDLRVVDSSMVTVKLKWTVPDSNAQHDKVRMYDLRFSTAPINSENWAQAAPWFAVPVPGGGGEPDSVVVGGLSVGTRHYFAINCHNLHDSWSGLSNVAHCRTLDDVVVSFPDTGLESAIRAMIAKLSGDIHGSELMGYTQLAAENHGIVDLTGVEYCRDLIFLHVSDNGISDLMPVATLTALKVLGMRNNEVADLSPLAGMVGLEAVIMPDNHLTNLTPLQNLPNLHTLHLHNNQITDLAPLVVNDGFGAGDELQIAGNPLSDQARDVQIPALEAKGVVVHQ